MTPGPLNIPDELAVAAESMRRLVQKGATVLLAVSGGSDSMGMMELAAHVYRSGDVALRVGFVDHGLREGIDREWKIVEERSAKLGIEAHRVNVSSAVPDGDSVQQWARDVRYGLLEELAVELRAAFIATAHTRDDQAETVMLRLLRGTGLDGLSGIPKSRTHGQVEIVRPMLGVGRDDIRVFLDNRGVGWVEDPSNANTRFLRVRVRNELLPLMDSLQPGIQKRLAALAVEMGGISRFVDDRMQGEKSITTLRLAGGVKVSSEVFQAFPREVWGRLVRFAIRSVKGDLRRLSRSHFEAIEELLAGGKCTDELPVPGEGRVHVYRGSLLVFPGEFPPKPTGSGQPSASGSGMWKARFAALGAIAEIRADDFGDVKDLEVRARRPGDKLAGSGRKFKQVLIDGGIPRPYRDFVPVLARGKEVISCPALVRGRQQSISIRWLLDDNAPFLDIDFPMST